MAHRRSGFSFFFLVLGAALALAACGDSNRGRRDGGGSDGGGIDGPCSAGDVQCDGRDVYTCMDGEFVFSESCGDERVCAIDLGCRTCQPGRPVCIDNAVHICDDSGETTTLQEECTGMDVCKEGACIDACSAAIEDRSNVGCDYYAADLDNEWGTTMLGDLVAAEEQYAVVLANPSTVEVEAIVTLNEAEAGQPARTREVGRYMVPPNDLVRIDLPQREVDGRTSKDADGPNTYYSANAYRITTNYPVVAYQFNPIVQSYSNDASLLIPAPALDTHYRVLGWPTANPIEPFGDMPGLPDHSFVTIIGTQENTDVRVTLGGPIDSGGGVEAKPAGGVVEWTLGPYEVLNLESTDVPGDLSGTIVESTAPVAVFSGGERAIAPMSTDGVSAHPDGVPEDWCCTEHLEEQVFPTSSWGKDFVMTRSPVRSAHSSWKEPDIYRVMADKDGTEITTNLPAPNDSITLSSNEWTEFSTDRSFIMRSNQPVSIEQILVSQGWVVDWKDGHGGDPSMILYPPFEQYREEYIFLVPDTFTANYVVISSPDGTTVELDGSDINGDEFMSLCTYEEAGDIDGTIYTAVTCPVEGGTHTIDATNPVGIMVYGYHSVGSYGYAGGSNLEKINLF